jgi:hypothetical protein
MEGQRALNFCANVKSSLRDHPIGTFRQGRDHPQEWSFG